MTSVAEIEFLGTGVNCLAGFDARGIDPAGRGDQLLQRLGRNGVELVVDDAALERCGKALGLGRSAAIGSNGAA